MEKFDLNVLAESPTEEMGFTLVVMGHKIISGCNHYQSSSLGH